MSFFNRAPFCFFSLLFSSSFSHDLFHIPLTHLSPIPLPRPRPRSAPFTPFAQDDWFATNSFLLWLLCSRLPCTWLHDWHHWRGCLRLVCAIDLLVYLFKVKLKYIYMLYSLLVVVSLEKQNLNQRNSIYVYHC